MDSDESDVDDHRALPTATSEWDLLCLQSVDIHYNNHFHNLPSDILDIVHAKTGMFGPLTEKQEEFTKNLQNSISFSCSITELLGIGLDLNVETFIQEVEKDIEKNKCSSRPGSAWRLIMNIHQVDVTSTSDVVIMTKDHCIVSFQKLHLLSSLQRQFCIDICQILFYMFQLKNLSVFTKDVDDGDEEQPTTRTHRNTSSDSSELKKSRRQVGQKVLGQHGGDLLLHQSLYPKTLDEERRMRYIPGMIVIGTEITFTLLALHGKHLAELRSKDGNIRHKSIINYSKPRDLLKKEDRDILLDSFDPYLAFLDFRNTLTEGFDNSPAEKPMNRKTRTLLTTKESLLRPKVVAPNKVQIELTKQQKQQFYYNQGTKDLPTLKNVDTVRIQPSKFIKEWKKGTIKQQVNIRSYEVDVGARTIRRNRRQLKQTLEDDNNTEIETERDNPHDFEHGGVNNQDHCENAPEIENAKETPIITRSKELKNHPHDFV
ncbi:unnamed protein product [Mytilus coruscus]|uniref:Uncharacterized protein n=1 Tax=Mytilus coruscus TaxID=42192 RepID=A0A6J8BD31_MYTCO|nr:unnamed protein product [Mytilus coruscus]